MYIIDLLYNPNNYLFEIIFVIIGIISFLSLYRISSKIPYSSNLYIIGLLTLLIAISITALLTGSGVETAYQAMRKNNLPASIDTIKVAYDFYLGILLYNQLKNIIYIIPFIIFCILISPFCIYYSKSINEGLEYSVNISLIIMFISLGIFNILPILGNCTPLLIDQDIRSIYYAGDYGDGKIVVDNLVLNFHKEFSNITENNCYNNYYVGITDISDIPNYPIALSKTSFSFQEYLESHILNINLTKILLENAVEIGIISGIITILTGIGFAINLIIRLNQRNK